MFSVSSVARFKIPPRSILFIEVSSGSSKLVEVLSLFLSVLSLDVFKNQSQEQHVKIFFAYLKVTFKMPYYRSIKLIKSYFDQRHGFSLHHCALDMFRIRFWSNRQLQCFVIDANLEMIANKVKLYYCQATGTGTGTWDWESRIETVPVLTV